MEVRGRNGKWLGAGNGRTVRVGWVNMVCKFCPRICGGRRGMDAFIIIDIIKHYAEVGHHECVGGENRGRNRRGLVNGKEGVDCGELAANFFFLDVKELSDVYDHLLMGESQFAVGGTVWRRRGNEVGGAASAVGRRGGARRNENGGRGAGHGWAVMWYV